MDDTTAPPALSVSVTGSEFYANAANGDGGAIYIRGDAMGILLGDLTIDGNVARGIAGGSDGEGGGVKVVAGPSTNVFVTDVDFSDNTALGNGGGLGVEATPGGGASSANLLDVLFFDNRVSR